VKVLLVTNPSSGSSSKHERDDLCDGLRRLGPLEVVEPSSESLDEQVQEAARNRDLVVSAGGDGTLNCTVNALRHRLEEITFALIPLGTGNDLARTLDLVDLDPVDLAKALSPSRVVPLDVGMASGTGAERLFVNACMGGFPVKVTESLDDDEKERLGAAAFIWGGAKALASLERSTVRVQGEAVPSCVAAGVGNGRTCGGGIEVWPEADPGDGLLDACALPAEGPVDLAKVAAAVKLGRHQGIDGVVYRRSASLTIEADPAIEINVDGELVGLRTPATFETFTRTRLMLPAVTE
jgi:diacylglycerol kinase (ATP)